MNLHVAQKLRDVIGALQLFRKQISSVNVEGLSLVREDLEGPGAPRQDKKRRSIVHGQKHEQPVTRTRVSMPSGMGDHPQSEVTVKNAKDTKIQTTEPQQ